jgi:predicted aspartyl protease
MAVSSDLKVIRLKLNPIAIQALVDTGASHCLVQLKLFRR